MIFDIKNSKMISADTNCEMLTLEAIQEKYKVAFDLDLHGLFNEELYTVNPIEIQLLRDIQRLEKRSR